MPHRRLTSLGRRGSANQGARACEGEDEGAPRGGQNDAGRPGGPAACPEGAAAERCARQEDSTRQAPGPGQPAARVSKSRYASDHGQTHLPRGCLDAAAEKLSRGGRDPQGPHRAQIIRLGALYGRVRLECSGSRGCAQSPGGWFRLPLGCHSGAAAALSCDPVLSR